MRTNFSVSVLIEDEEKAKQIFSEIQHACAQTENIFSRFDTESELSTLNREKRIRPSSLFCSIFAEAKKAFFYTDRVFNPMCSPYFFGYREDFETQNFSDPIPLREKNFERLEIDNNGFLEIPNHSFLDFGGIVKGWLADHLAKKYRDACHGIIVNLGGDIAVQGSDINSSSFALSLWNPVTEKKIPLLLANSTLCTSGTYKRKWGNHNHIIDPFCISSADSHCISASIIHPDGALCEAIATACVIWGIEKGIAFLEEQNIDYCLIREDGKEFRNKKK